MSWIANILSKGQNTEAAIAVSQLKANVSEAEQRYQEVLRRELANIIQDINLEEFEKAFYKMCDFEAEMSRASPERRAAELEVLVQRYPFFSEFDIITKRHFVRYDREKGSEYYIDRYLDISKFLVLSIKNSAKRLYDDQEVMVFQRCIKEQKALRLKSLIKEAMDRLHRHSASLEKTMHTYEDADFSVFKINSMNYSPEISYGIECKKIGEYGVYSFYVDDNAKIYHSYYRSDKLFSEQSRESLWT